MGEGGRVDLRTPLPAAGDAGGDTQRCLAATLWQAGSLGISCYLHGL